MDNSSSSRLGRRRGRVEGAADAEPFISSRGPITVIGTIALCRWRTMRPRIVNALPATVSLLAVRENDGGDIDSVLPVRSLSHHHIHYFSTHASFAY